jgi:hypothetical protein
MKILALHLLCVLLVCPTGVFAQERARERLERQLRSAPEDTRILCEVGWARFLARAPLDYASLPLDRGIALLGEPADPALRLRLAACLYSRGRVHEAQGASDEAARRYERSLELRPNDVVERRLNDARARSAAAWREVERGVPTAQLARAAGTADLESVEVQRSYASPDGRFEAWLLQVDIDVAMLAVRERGGAWTATSVADYRSPNGMEDFTLEVAPAAPSAPSPTFVVRYRWDHRTCCDEEGMPDWTEGMSVFLLWRGADGAWSRVALGERDVEIGADGGIAVEASADGPRRYLPARPREALLAR